MHVDYVSIRSPDRSQGRRRLRRCLLNLFRVSIRSPDRSQGRRSAEISTGSPLTFQSAPLTGARGDPAKYQARELAEMFQSAPLTGARGDHAGRYEAVMQAVVSIRSPDRSQGRLGRSITPAPGVVFQSAPLTGARGDAGCCNQRNSRQLSK